jgi:hypothetical protein
VTGRFPEQKGFHRFGMYVQDYGGPVELQTCFLRI